jgi:hypothetical protein
VGHHHGGKALVFDQALTNAVTNTYCAVLQGVGVWAPPWARQEPLLMPTLQCLTKR